MRAGLDQRTARDRNWVERFFNRVKQYCGLATRYEKSMGSSSR
ncbi:MAG: transposase [Myxococcales bacterium]|nr:transposase [Myxococcales bacterium]